MRRWTNRIFRTLALFAVASVSAAYAEVTVTVSITGSIDEILPILRHLQDLGIGAAGSEALKMQVHSVMSSSETPAAGATLGFQNATIEPVVAKAGDSVLVTVKVGDPDHIVDTVAVSLGGATLDLFDNGTNGDVKALDGTWSRSVPLPATLPTGDVVASISAYDISGDAVELTNPDGSKTPMATQAKVSILPSGAPIPAPPAATPPAPAAPPAPAPPAAPAKPAAEPPAAAPAAK